MSQVPVLAVDSDDIVKGLNRAFSPYIYEKTGIFVPFDDIYSFHYEEVFDMSREQVMTYFEDFCTNRHHTIEPVPGALEGLATLAKHYELHLVTSRNESYRDITLKWHQENKTGQYFKQFHFTNGSSKVDIAQQIGAKALIDDALHNAQDAAEAGIPVLLLNTPWNQTDSLPKSVTRLYSWPEITSYLIMKVRLRCRDEVSGARRRRRRAPSAILLNSLRTI